MPLGLSSLSLAEICREIAWVSDRGILAIAALGGTVARELVNE